MKKNHILIIALLLIFQTRLLQAQGWAKPANGGGGTNVYDCFAFDKDNNPVIMGSTKDVPGSEPDGFVFIKLDKTTGTRTLLKKYNGNNNSECYKIFNDANGNIYYLGSFMDHIAFGPDTLFTYNRVYWNQPNLFLAKFDNEGNHIWSHKFGRKGIVAIDDILDAHINESGIHIMIPFAGDSVFYNDSLLEKLPFHTTYIHNFCLFSFNLGDGGLSNFKNVTKFYNTYPVMFSVLPNNTFEIGAVEPTTTSFVAELKIYTFNTSGEVNLKCSTIIKQVTQHKGDEIKKVVNLGGNYFAFTINNQSGNAGSIYGNDTILVMTSPYNLRSGSLIKFDSTLKMVNYKRFQWIEKNPTIDISNTKLIVGSRFNNTMYIESDSIVSRNNQRSLAVIAFDQDLNITDTFQINTANSTGGSFSLKQAGYDKSGNLYGQVVHNKDILFYGTTVKAALKSWDHLTVLARKGDNQSSGVNNNKLSNPAAVFPNPATNTITLNVEVNQVKVQNIAGQTILNGNSQTIDISSLTPGVYFIQASDGVSFYHSKFVKN